MHAADRLAGIFSSLAHSNNPTETPTDIVLGNMTEYKFFGWVGKDKDCIGNLVWEEYEPKSGRKMMLILKSVWLYCTA